MNVSSNVLVVIEERKKSSITKCNCRVRERFYAKKNVGFVFDHAVVFTFDITDFKGLALDLEYFRLSDDDFFLFLISSVQVCRFVI